MTKQVFALLLDKTATEFNNVAMAYQHVPAVAQRIRLLAANLAQPSRWSLFRKRFSRKFRQNLAELEALLQYGSSKAAWEIAYLSRKQAAGVLSERETLELENLVLYHDSPDVLRITLLKVKEATEWLDMQETRELAYLQRNLYRKDGVPEQLMDLLWGSPKNTGNPVELFHVQ